MTLCLKSFIEYAAIVTSYVTTINNAGNKSDVSIYSNAQRKEKVIN